jgi:hypothetical protein
MFQAHKVTYVEDQTILDSVKRPGSKFIASGVLRARHRCSSFKIPPISEVVLTGGRMPVTTDYDPVVVGADFAGVYMLHRGRLAQGDRGPNAERVQTGCAGAWGTLLQYESEPKIDRNLVGS